MNVFIAESMKALLVKISQSLLQTNLYTTGDNCNKSITVNYFLLSGMIDSIVISIATCAKLGRQWEMKNVFTSKNDRALEHIKIGRILVNVRRVPNIRTKFNPWKSNPLFSTLGIYCKKMYPWLPMLLSVKKSTLKRRLHCENC